MDVNDDELRAAEDIRNLVGRYCDAIARLDLDTVGACWATDGVWTVFDQELQGRAAILATFRELTSRVEWVVQHANSGVIEFDEVGATGVWQIVEYGRSRSADGPGKGAGMIHVGRYEDEYVLQDGDWVFASRRFDTLHYSGLAFE